MKLRFSFFNRKQKKTKPIEVLLEELNEAYEDKKKDQVIQYDRLYSELRTSYEEKIDEARMHEKEMPFDVLLKDAESEAHPLEYATEQGSMYYKKVTFFRSKQSPNPFRIIVEVHKNCVFLGVTSGEREQVNDNLITLYYDKIKKVYQEYAWKISDDFATKYHLRMFLYAMMDHVRDDKLHDYPYYKTEYRARNEFWRDEHAWSDEYNEKVKKLEEEQEEELTNLIQWYEIEKGNLLKDMREKEQVEWQIKVQQIKEKKEEEQRQEQRKDWILQSNQQRVFDPAIEKKMRAVYDYAHQLLKKEKMLDLELAHELGRLYEKDLQEVWQVFVSMDERKQKEQSRRFLALLEGLENRLSYIEERMAKMDEMDFEKKISYMEKKYLH